MTPKIRKKIEGMIYTTLDKLDPSKVNSDFYKKKFATMNIKQFQTFASTLGENQNWISLEIVPYKEPDMDMIEDAAKYLNVPLEEYVYFPSESVDGKPTRSYSKVPVGYTNLRRMSQIISKKNSYTDSIDKRSQLTGQVTGASKAGSFTNPEVAVISMFGGNAIIEEMLGPRADNKAKKRSMYQQIERNGYATLAEAKADADASGTGLSSNVALNTVDANFLAAGIKTNLISDNNILIKAKKIKT